jgi:hypothetical protein
MEPIVSSTVYEIDQLLMRLAGVHVRLLGTVARAAFDVMETRTWLKFGYRNCEDFARERLDRNGRWLRRLSALHRALLNCPALRLAINARDGGPPLRRAAAFEICSVVSAANATQWIARARQMSVRELSEMVRAERRKAQDGDRKRDGRQTDRQVTAALALQVSACDVDTVREQPLVYLRIPAPPEAHVSHDEVMDLHGAVVGQSLSVKDFVEDLLGEASSGGCAPITTPLPRSVSPANAQQETLSTEQVKKRRRFLERRSAHATRCEQTTSMRLARDTLARIEALAVSSRSSATPPARDEPSDAGHPAGARVRTLLTLIRSENEIEIRAAQLLVDLAGHAPWKALGFTGLAQYAAERLGWRATETYRRVRLARKLRQLTAVQAAYENGRIGVEATTWVVQNIQRVAPNIETQRSWLQHARTTTIKRLRDEDRLLQRERLLARGAVARSVTETHARPRPHIGTQPTSAPSGRRCPALQAPSDAAWKSFTGRAPGRARNLVLALGSQLVERVVMRGALAELPLCFCLPQDLAESFWGCIESARRGLLQRAPLAGHEPPAQEARLAPSERIVRHLFARGDRIPHWVGYLSLLEDFVCTWDDPVGMKRGTNDAIHNQDGWRCGAPGCTRRRNLQTHHLEHRARGGCDAAWNLHDACGFHHLLGEHGGLAHCTGRAPLHVVWRLGIRELGTWYRNERRISPPTSA